MCREEIHDKLNLAMPPTSFTLESDLEGDSKVSDHFIITPEPRRLRNHNCEQLNDCKTGKD